MNLETRLVWNLNSAAITFCIQTEKVSRELTITTPTTSNNSDNNNFSVTQKETYIIQTVWFMGFANIHTERQPQWRQMRGVHVTHKLICGNNRWWPEKRLYRRWQRCFCLALPSPPSPYSFTTVVSPGTGVSPRMKLFQDCVKLEDFSDNKTGNAH